MGNDELAHKRELLAMLKKRKQERELQLAQFGMSADPIIKIEIEHLEQQIEIVENEVIAISKGRPALAHHTSMQPIDTSSRRSFVYPGLLFIIALLIVIVVIR